MLAMRVLVGPACSYPHANIPASHSWSFSVESFSSPLFHPVCFHPPLSLLEPALLIHLSHLPSPPYYAAASGTSLMHGKYLVDQIHCMPTSRLRRCRLGPRCYMPVLLTIEIWMKFTTWYYKCFRRNFRNKGLVAGIWRRGRRWCNFLNKEYI